MLLSKPSTTARCLGLVSTVFIAPNGGRANYAAKTLATLWYLLVLPDSQSRLQLQLHNKRKPWYSPARIFGALLAAGNIVTMPLSWGLLFAGKRNASRIASVGVLLNPPSFIISMLLITELSSTLAKKSLALAKGVRNIVAKPFTKKEPVQGEPAPSEPVQGSQTSAAKAE